MIMDVEVDGGKITKPIFPNGVISNDNRRIFVLNGEHKRIWRAENPNGHIGVCLKIDGGLITSTNQNKCDGGLLLDDNRLYLVEFKGRDYEHAVEQLKETKKYFKNNYSEYDFDFYARIVGKSFPKSSTARQKAIKVLGNNFGKKYKIFENQGHETI